MHYRLNTLSQYSVTFKTVLCFVFCVLSAATPKLVGVTLDDLDGMPRIDELIAGGTDARPA